MTLPNTPLMLCVKLPVNNRICPQTLPSLVQLWRTRIQVTQNYLSSPVAQWIGCLPGLQNIWVWFLLETLIFSLSRSHVMLVSSLIIVLQCTGIVIYLLGTIFHPLNNSVAAQPVWKHTCMSLIHFSAGMLDLHTSSAFQPKCTSFTSMALNRLFNNMSGWKKTCRLE